LDRIVGSIVGQLKLQPVINARNGVIAAVVLIVCTWLAVAANTRAPSADGQQEATAQGRRVGALYYPTPKQWEALTMAPVSEVVFRSEHMTEGKIAVDEDRSTLVFSPYSGRVIKLLAKPGDAVKAGQPLFIVEAPDMVQAQNDFINAISALNKARSALELAKIVEQQNKTLFDSRAGSLRDLQQAQATTRAADNDVRAAQTLLEAARNRLRILGMTDDDITKFSDTGAVSSHMTIYAPIAGTVIQRKVGPVNISTRLRKIRVPVIRLSSSAICPRFGSWLMSANLKRQTLKSGKQCTSPFLPILIGCSPRTSRMSRLRSIQGHAGCWCARQLTIRSSSCGLKCLRTLPFLPAKETAHSRCHARQSSTTARLLMSGLLAKTNRSSVATSRPDFPMDR